ncbi:hypothetical protein [Pararhodobacter sp.]|uniref:hypothetical protein n=1 Tax=Pararhodobacter sp. TaxID=2127056 RepID=UPI002FDD3EDD
MRKVIAVNANKSWYEGYIPLYIHFALRACPDADVLVHVMGPVDPIIPATLDILGADRSRYKIIENYKLGYGQAVIGAKLARWTMDHDLIRSYDLAYIGDIDMFLADEGENDLFRQHLNHTQKLGVPISNKVRENQERLTGLHFFVCEPYFDALGERISELDAEIMGFEGNEAAMSKYYPKSDEKVLYRMVNDVRPEWIERIKTSNFRPYHGAHMGNFRNTDSKAYRYLSDCVAANRLSRSQTLYQTDIYIQMRNMDLFDRCRDLLAAYPKVGEACRQFFEFVERRKNMPAFEGDLEK